jgi:phytoene dehydrogenase-like protein
VSDLLHPTLIIGGGAAGLAAARTLHAAGRPFLLLEGSAVLGGRLRTTRHPEGFLLDHGFQILLTSYPEARRWLGDYAALRLRSFRSGARVRVGDEWISVLNPLKEGLAAVGHLGGGLATWPDRLRLARLAAFVETHSDEALLAHAPGTTARQFLVGYGFSEGVIDRFFRPFFGGVFLDRDLTPAAGLLLFLFKQFITTDAALPADGIQAVGAALAAPLPAASVRLQAPVERLDGLTAVLTSGERLLGSAIIIATEADVAARLLDRPAPPPTAWRATTVAYYAAPVAPAPADRLLALRPVVEGSAALVHNVAVPSDVAPTYAPAGQALISVSSHGAAALALSDAALDTALRTELAAWYGASAVQTWRWLDAYRLPHALPATDPVVQPTTPVPVRPGVWVCGDYTRYPSLNAALASGRIVAEALLV